MYCEKLADKLASLYPKGTRVRCLQMIDDPHPVPPGVEGTVQYTNGFGQIAVRWDNGSGLFLLYGIDNFEVIK